VRPRFAAPRCAGILFLPLLLGLGLLSGCSSSSTSAATNVQAFQHGVEQYLAQRNNDPQATDDVTLEDGRRGFAVLGGLDPRHSTDQRALLLAHKVIGDRPWFVYIVGTVKNDVVQDLRLVALSAAGGQTVWRIGPKNTAAFKQYRDAALKDWHAHSDPGKSKPPPQYTTFPRASDTFEVSTDATTARARHTESGAEFSVAITQATAGAGKKGKK